MSSSPTLPTGIMVLRPRASWCSARRWGFLVERDRVDAADTQGVSVGGTLPEVTGGDHRAVRRGGARVERGPTPFGWDGRRAARLERARKRRHALGGSRACARRPIRRRKRRATAVENWQRENQLTYQCSGLFIAQGMNDTRVSRLHGAL
jgi:hypothetical protein